MKIRAIMIDCTDHYAQCRWWESVLDDYADAPDDPNYPDDETMTLVGPEAQPWLCFQRVEDSKRTKNRLHFDLHPLGRTRDEEVERLLGLGATVVGDHRRPNGSGWVTMADPEGNEFCVERSEAEMAAGQ